MEPLFEDFPCREHYTQSIINMSNNTSPQPSNQQSNKQMLEAAEFGTNCYLKGWQDAFEHFKKVTVATNINKENIKREILKSLEKAQPSDESRIIKP